MAAHRPLALPIMVAYAAISFTLCLLPAARAPAAEDEAPEWLKSYFAAWQRSREETIVDCQRKIADIQHRRRKSENPRAEIAELKEAIAKAEAGKEPPRAQISIPLAVGNCGFLPLYQCGVKQVIGPKQYLAYVACDGGWINHFNPGSGQTEKMLSLRDMLVLIRGESTAELTDGKTFSNVNVFHCSGNYSYTNVAGASATVFVLEVVEPEFIARYAPAPKPIGRRKPARPGAK